MSGNSSISAASAACPRRAPAAREPRELTAAAVRLGAARDATGLLRRARRRRRKSRRAIRRAAQAVGAAATRDQPAAAVADLCVVHSKGLRAQVSWMVGEQQGILQQQAGFILECAARSGWCRASICLLLTVPQVRPAHACACVSGVHAGGLGGGVQAGPQTISPPQPSPWVPQFLSKQVVSGMHGFATTSHAVPAALHAWPKGQLPQLITSPQLLVCTPHVWPPAQVVAHGAGGGVTSWHSDEGPAWLTLQ